MSHLVTRRRPALALGALALVGAGPAFAADLAYPYPPAEPAPRSSYREERVEEPPPPRAEVYGPRFVAGPRFAPPPPEEECRTIVKRRIDPDGDEVERRVRICEDVSTPRPRPHVRPSFHDPGLPPVPSAELPEERFEPPPRW